MKKLIPLALAVFTLTGCMGTGGENGEAASSAPLLIVMALMLGLMYLIMVRPQKKRDKQAQELRNSIEIGDEVTTIGGIVGRVVSIKEDTFIIETSGERSRMRFKRWAIQDVGKLSLDSGSSSGTASASSDTEPAAEKKSRASKRKTKDSNGNDAVK